MASSPINEPGEYLERKLTLFTNPAEFFEESLKYPHIWKAAALVIVAGIAFMLQGIATWMRMPLEISTEVTFGLVMMTFVFFFTPIMLWFSAAMIWRMLVLIVGGNAKFYTLLRISGYGFPSFVLTGIAWAAGRYYALADAEYDFMSMTQLRMAQDEWVELAATQEFASNALSDPVFQLAFLIGLLFTVFAVYIWTYGIATAANIDRKRAAALAITPYAIFVWWVIEPVFL